MAVDTAAHIGSFDPTKPTGADALAEADDNLCHIKSVLKTDFANINGAVTASHAELNYVTGVTSALQTQLDAKAPLASPALTGTPTVPTATAGTSTTQAASTAFVQTAIAGVNAQTTLTIAISSSASVSVTVGQHVICTYSSGAITATLPSAPTSGQRCKVKFANGRYDNVIDPGSEKLNGLSGTKTSNAWDADVEFIYVNSSYGWAY